MSLRRFIIGKFNSSGINLLTTLNYVQVIQRHLDTLLFSGQRSLHSPVPILHKDSPSHTHPSLLAAHPGSVTISGATGEGIPELLVAIGDRLRALAKVEEFVVPYDRGDILAALHRAGEVLVEVHDQDATRVRVRMPEAAAGRFADFAAS